jgi:RNA polymerase sigma-70 factor (ECF subfamily)
VTVPDSTVRPKVERIGLSSSLSCEWIDCDGFREGGVNRETIELAMAGDHDAFTALAGQAIGPLYATARLIVRQDAVAQDATQEALVNAWRYLSTLRDPNRFDAWLYRLLVNSCRSQLRRSRRHEVVEIDVEALVQPSADPVRTFLDRDQLERGFRRLDADQRIVVILHYYRGYSVPEVASIVGVPVGTAKSRIHRATQALRAALDADARQTALAEGAGS